MKNMRKNSHFLLSVCASLSFGLVACVTEVRSPEPMADGAEHTAPIAVDLIFAGDPDDGGESVVHQQGLVRYQARSARVTNTLPPDLTVHVPIPAGTVAHREYVVSRLNDIADLLIGLGFDVERVCLGNVCH